MTAMAMRKSEQRDVRPFFAVEDFARVLDSAEIRLFEDSEFSERDSFSILMDEVSRLKPVIRPQLDRRLFPSSGQLKVENLSFIVSVTNRLLKKTVVLLRAPLAQAPKEIAIPEETLAELGRGPRLFIDLALCLDSDRKKFKPGEPFLGGHWLSRKSFAIKPIGEGSEFNIKPLDDEGWKARGLPPKTMYMAQYLGFMNEPFERDRPVAEVFVHSDIYRKLLVDPDAPAAAPILRFLTAEIVAQILVASRDDWKDEDEPASRSPLAGFLKRFGRSGKKVTFAELKVMTEEPGLVRLRAYLHANEGTVRAVVEA